MLLESCSGRGAMNPETLETYPAQGYHVHSASSAVVHRYNQILHSVGCDVTDDHLFDTADVAQHGSDL